MVHAGLLTVLLYMNIEPSANYECQKVYELSDG